MSPIDLIVDVESQEIHIEAIVPAVVSLTVGESPEFGTGGGVGGVGPAGPPGPQGIQGPAGPQGTQGPTGATGQAEAWYSQAGVPLATTGAVGDWDLNITTGDVYEKTAASLWTLRGNIKGATGPQGPGGVTPPPTGPTTYYGSVARPITFGKAVSGIAGSGGGGSSALYSGDAYSSNLYGS